jgi:hypothetical protein
LNRSTSTIGSASSVDQVGEVAHPAQLLERRVALEPLDQHDRFGQLTLADVVGDRRVEALVKRLVEVVRRE